MTFLTLLTSTVAGAPNRGQRSIQSNAHTHTHCYLLAPPVDDAVASVTVLEEEEVVGSD